MPALTTAIYTSSNAADTGLSEPTMRDMDDDRESGGSALPSQPVAGVPEIFGLSSCDQVLQLRHPCGHFFRTG